MAINSTDTTWGWYGQSHGVSVFFADKYHFIHENHELRFNADNIPHFQIRVSHTRQLGSPYSSCIPSSREASHWYGLIKKKIFSVRRVLWDGLTETFSNLITVNGKQLKMKSKRIVFVNMVCSISISKISKKLHIRHAILHSVFDVSINMLLIISQTIMHFHIACPSVTE